MAISLGHRPLELSVILSRGADFVAALIADTDWAPGTGIELVFSPTRSGAVSVVWAATIAGPRASWDVPADEVEAVLDSDATSVRLRYVEPDGTVLAWGAGYVDTA